MRGSRCLGLLLGLASVACAVQDEEKGGLAEAPPAAENQCATEPLGSFHFVATHSFAPLTAASPAPGIVAEDEDQAHVAILIDHGDLVIRRNPFDLGGSAVRLDPNRSGGYDPRPLSLSPGPAGTPLAVATDAAVAVDLPFAFPFFGSTWRQAFLHSDGSVTFGRPDPDSGERGLGRFLAGPPRVAAFFATLDPSRGGSVSARLSADRAAFLWSAVPGSGQINRNTFEVTLAASGEIDLAYGEVQSRDAVVGVAPGASASATAADLSAGLPSGSTGALAERFSSSEEADLVSIVRRFLQAHPDSFEQVVIYTTRPLNPLPGSLAFEVNVRNDIGGIGQDPLDDTARWGSAGALASVVYMDSVDQYLAVDGFEILGHEVGHRWLARLRFRKDGGAPSAALLGRGGVHWSFFMDTRASVMEGNLIADLGGGKFETTDIVRGYSPLDQYAMGLRLPAEVPPFFYVDGADNFRPNRAFKASSSPEAGISFTGLRRDVAIEDVLAAMGPRTPDATLAPRLLRQAFVLVADETAPATPERRAAIARIRARFGPYYREATEGRGSADSTLP
jgi:hypothetical protein